jgi:hypothetical protein
MSIKSNSTGTIPVKPPFSFVQIKVEWQDQLGSGGKSFYTVHELATFLEENPLFAEAVKYSRKKPK